MAAEINMTEQFTIAIPVYGRTTFFREVIDCLIHQTVKCKVLVVDNASPHDEFKKIIEELNNPLFKYIKNEENVGVTLNMNKCINIVDTKWMTILHDDDLIHKQFVEFTQDILSKHDGKVGGFFVKNYVGPSCNQLSENLKLTDDIKIVNPDYFMFKNITPFPGAVFKTKIGQELKGFNHDHYPIADLDFWYRLSSKTKMLIVNQRLSFYRLSGEQSTNDLLHNMIDKNIDYRANIAQQLKIRNPITKLALQKSNSFLIEFYKNTYENYGGPDSNKFYSWLTNIWPINKLLNRHIKNLSFSSIKN